MVFYLKAITALFEAHPPATRFLFPSTFPVLRLALSNPLCATEAALAIAAGCQAAWVGSPLESRSNEILSDYLRLLAVVNTDEQGSVPNVFEVNISHGCTALTLINPPRSAFLQTAF